MNREQEDQIPDFIHNRLDTEARAAFLAQLEQDPELRQALAAEQAVASQLGAVNSATGARLSFDSIRPQVERTPFWQGTPVAIGAFASVLLLAFLLLPEMFSPRESAEYETLSNTPEAYSQAVVRLVVHSTDDIEALRRDYKLNIIRHYPAAHTIDVAGADLTPADQYELQSDARVKLLQRIQGTSP
jgi:hypothetical protein